MQVMAQDEAMRRRNAYRNRAALAGLGTLVVVFVAIACGFWLIGSSQWMLVVLPSCIFLPLVVYVILVRRLAGRMGLLCARCGRRILSARDIASGRCGGCGGACVEASA
jgi:hypothetical protein